MTRDKQDTLADFLADFLAVGMSLTEARKMKLHEDKLAEIKQRAREVRREAERGAIMSRSCHQQTRVGPTAHGGRRGSLSFN